MIISKEQSDKLSREAIETSNGTDRPYGEIMYEHWQDKLGQNPTYDELIELRKAIKRIEVKLEQLNKEYPQNLNDEQLSSLTLKNIDMFKDALSSLKRLLSEYETGTIDKTLPTAREVAVSISSKGSSKWSEQVIYNFLATYVKNKSLSVEKVREKAIEMTKKDSVKFNLADVPGPTLYTWISKVK